MAKGPFHYGWRINLLLRIRPDVWLVVIDLSVFCEQVLLAINRIKGRFLCEGRIFLGCL